ncbi:MAG TPA: cytochrome P450 [Thermoanaerobaculia bacterium]|nr:cytochrome P450 [Thermoanaerobaculia bacterium]
MSRLPPGSSGLPLLGETLPFAKNPFRFLEERLAKYGRVFRTNVLGRKTVVVAGPEAAGRFIDGSVVMREGSMPPHVQELFGGRSLPLLDGDAHAARKSTVLAAFTREAMASYVPIIEGAVQRSFAKWAGAGEIRWLDEMKRLAIEVICSTFFGLEPGDEMDRLRNDYDILTRGFATLPINLPGTPYRNALKARDRILGVLRRIVRERRAAPSDDGLSRILKGGEVSDDDLALELHHIVVAGFIVYGELAAIVRQLTDHPDVRERLQKEGLMLQSPYLLQFVNEVKRLTPIVPVVFGKSRKEFEFDGVAVPAGWMVLWAVNPSHAAHGVYDDAQRFDPDRFSPARAEDRRHEHAFAPQGAGPITGHRCPGLDFATVFMSVFTIALLRGYTWELPPQRFDYDWSKVPPEVRDGLRARVTAS